MIVAVIVVVVPLFVYSAEGAFQGEFVVGKRFQASWRWHEREVERGMLEGYALLAAEWRGREARAGKRG